MLSNSGHDERGGYSGGRAGDQSGTEWYICPWYQYAVGSGWEYMIRHPNREIGKLISDLACEAAANDNIGYDQNERYSFWGCLPEAGYHPANINRTCEADCSAGVAAIVKCVGMLTGNRLLANVSADCYTGNIRRALENAGFEVYTNRKYLDSPDYLLPGDFLLKEGWHICTNVTAGSAVDPEEGEDELVAEIYRKARLDKVFRKAVYRYVGIDNLPVRCAPGDAAPLNPAWPYLSKNNGVIVYCGFDTGYVYCEISAGSKSTAGYVEAKYLSKTKLK